jgi:nucleotide-binding universal stress UspA family protein
LASLEATLKRENVKAKIIQECGDVVTIIINVAFREDVDLIAMSCRESTGSQKSISNSVIYRLLLQADRPLIITQIQRETEVLDRTQRCPVAR